MLTLTLGDLNDEKFMDSIGKLADNSELPVDVAQNISELLQEISNSTRDAKFKYMELIKDFAKFDDDGSLVPEVVDGKPVKDSWVFNTPEAEEEKIKFLDKWIGVNNSFLAEKVHFKKVNPVELQDLEDCGLSPRDLMYLAPIIKNLDEEDLPN
jgi:hypothetical protein